MARRSLCSRSQALYVTAEPELGLELQGGDTVRVAGHDVNGHEPGLQGQVAAVHDRACGHRGLLPAGRTFPARPAPLQSPAPVMAAGGADEAVGPAPGGEMPAQEASSGKRALESGAGHGAVIFPAAGHDRTLHEHTADAHQKLNISSNRAQRDRPFSLIGTRKKIHLEEPLAKQLRRGLFCLSEGPCGGTGPTLVSIMCCRKTPHDDHGGVEPCPCARCYWITGTAFNKSCSRGSRASLARWASATSCSSRF